MRELDGPLLNNVADRFRQRIEQHAAEPEVLYPYLKGYLMLGDPEHLDKQELYWRLDIVSGALTYAMADFGVIKRRAGSESQHRDLAAQHLVRFAAAGLRAEA